MFVFSWSRIVYLHKLGFVGHRQGWDTDWASVSKLFTSSSLQACLLREIYVKGLTLSLSMILEIISNFDNFLLYQKHLFCLWSANQTWNQNQGKCDCFCQFKNSFNFQLLMLLWHLKFKCQSTIKRQIEASWLRSTPAASPRPSLGMQ